MRKASNNVQVIGDGDTFYGVSLGSDFCAEHEWGIDDIRRKFGINKDKMGAEARKITKGEVFFAEDDTMCVLVSRKPWTDKKEYTPKDLLASDIRHFGNDIETAWDGGDFCIATQNKEFYKYLRELNEEFKKKNILICFLSSKIPSFENASLSVLIQDRLPKEITDSMYAADKKSNDLAEYEIKIGVTKLKEKARENSSYKGEKYFMACSPRWINYEDEKAREVTKKQLGTKYDIQFWINYSDDDDNYGWYTAEQIIQWLSTPGLKLKSLNKK